MFYKKLLLLCISIAMLSFYAMAQNNQYTTNWKKVEALDAKGLTQSALKEVMAIYQLASSQNNSTQQIKCCLYQIRFKTDREENSQEKNIFFIDTLIAQAAAPVKNILQSMQAEMYWQYLQNNRYKFYSHSKLAKEKSKDISTWSIDKLHATIAALYKASIEAPTEVLLKATSLTQYDDILLKGENTRNLRPTLYDFLTHRALAYFITDENDLTKPAYQFTINNNQAFAPANEFITSNFETKDKASLHYYAIQLYKNLLHFHSTDVAKNALIDADISRLQFVHQYAVIENKNQLYQAALKNIEVTNYNTPAIAQAMFLRAKIYYDNATENQQINKQQQYDIKRAKELCDTIVATFANSEGGINAANLITQILQPSLQLQTEWVNVPNQPFRTLVTYKNTPTLYFRVIKTSSEALLKMGKNDEEKNWEELAKLTPTKNWQLQMPDPKDFQQHSVEIKIDALNNGVYVLMASISKNFSTDSNILSRQIVHVSNIACVHTQKNYYILNRTTGLPITNANIQIWESKYNYTIGNYETKKAEKYSTDVNGFFVLKNTVESRDITLQISTPNDELHIDRTTGEYENNYPTTQTIQPVSFLFMDRSIYRPGQTIYFKGIVLQQDKDANKNKTIKGFKTTIQLKDANGQKINDATVISNEYGSYTGSFTLPANGLNGNFSIIDINTNATEYFSVEEYKRPTFLVQINKPTGTYRVNDSIAITLDAKGYAGNSIDHAQVKYSVVRKTKYPDWWGWGGYSRGAKYSYTNNNEVVITDGTVTTDKNGKATITFKALPDESMDKKEQPIFNFTIVANVTDNNGETRSSETNIAIAYQALQMQIALPEKISATNFKNIIIKTTNLNDIGEAANVEVQLFALLQPNIIFRERLWQKPDQFLMSENEYRSYFANDIYNDENETKNWKIIDKIFNKIDSSNTANAFAIASNSLAGGWYKIVATTKDKFGEIVMAEKYIQVTSNMPTQKSEAISIQIDTPQAAPSQKIEYTIETAFNNIWLIHTLVQVNNNFTTSTKNLAINTPWLQQVKVTEADRGGMAINYLFVKNNQVYQGNESIDIPWSNKQLSIKYSTFRDKLLPGQTEKLTVKIEGLKGEAVAAEMLASMYDESLDQFKPHNWAPWNIWPQLHTNMQWQSIGFEAATSIENEYYSNNYFRLFEKEYDRLNYFERGLNFSNNKLKLRVSNANAVTYAFSTNGTLSTMQFAASKMENDKSASPKHMKMPKPVFDDTDGDGIPNQIDKEPNSNKAKTNNVQIRKNFAETAFFYPNIYADTSGNFSFSFTMPDAVTKWKLQTLAHTNQAAIGYNVNTLVTQKSLMVQTNAPRFLTEGDNIELSSKISNLSDSELTGTVTLELLDATTNTPVDGWFKNIFPSQYFTVAAGQSVAIKFPVEIPFNFNSALTYRVVAVANTFSDGEENTIPILSNRILVTESIPINVRNSNSKTVQFTKLLNSANSTSISHHAITLEYTSNPAWYAVQALPYLMEYPYECAEQTFNRYYANTLAAYITNTNPTIKSVFEKWKTIDTAALLSNLQKNEALKNVLLQETPWVVAAQNETQQKQQIALLFDMVKMNAEQAKAFATLKEMQSPNGGFVWFKGGPDDQYITQYIITGIGHLRKLNALTNKDYALIEPMVNKAIAYLDKKITTEYQDLIKHKKILLKNNVSNTAIQYLYMRSFFVDKQIPAATTPAFKYFIQQTEKYWLAQSKYMQGMIALTHHRFLPTIITDKKIKNTPKAIIASLQQNAIVDAEQGMYWKEWATTGGYYWHQAPIESQAMMIEAFTEIEGNTNTINDLKTWLLQQKQTQNWKTTKATAEACYALLLQGNNWLQATNQVNIQLGNTTIKSTDDNTEAGTGYFTKKIAASNVQASMGNINVHIQPTSASTTNNTSWGAVYWQYFEDIDKITASQHGAGTSLKLSKKLFIEKNTDKGTILEALEDGATLKVGSKVLVRIELTTDRDMEYVHLKDVRAACMEPINVLSAYKYQGGLGYYESTKDASTNFFFNWISKGTYIFEYPLFVTHTGNFSNGIATIQCMYAPAFTSHSEGLRITVE